jgi:hypothetical protein
MKEHITDNENIHGFFSFISKAVLIIPILMVILALFIKFNQPQSIPPQSNQVIPTPASSDLKFDLKGPIVCDNLFILDKKVFFRNKETNYLLSGDCLYNWIEGKSKGGLKCGLSGYISMAESYLGFLSIEDLTRNSMVKNFVKEKNINIADVLSTCKRGNIKDKSVFNIPKKVVFSP